MKRKYKEELCEYLTFFTSNIHDVYNFIIIDSLVIDQLTGEENGKYCLCLTNTAGNI